MKGPLAGRERATGGRQRTCDRELPDLNLSQYIRGLLFYGQKKMRGKNANQHGISNFIYIHIRALKRLLPRILESNPHPNLIRTSFCRFLKLKKS